ncbi:MAG: patatin-like phospholipase family protein [Candidatus Binatales bacterium]
MARRALVLGGGGPVGIAWESGIVAGLEHEGVAAGGADLIVGTSAGSVVGAQLALGRSGEELLAAQIAEASRAGSQPSADAAPAPDLGPLIQMMMNRPAEGELPVPKRVEIGAFALRAKTIGEETFIANFGRVAEARGAFPERFVCTAIDAVDGSFATWNKAAGVELGRAVASSCAVPGIFPPITIKGRRYYDGGIRSTTNSDLARGYDIVLVVAVTIAALPPAYRQRLDAEIAALEASCSKPALIVPDAECLEIFGFNLMDSSRRTEIARLGERQGRLEAARLRDFWN